MVFLFITDSPILIIIKYAYVATGAKSMQEYTFYIKNKTSRLSSKRCGGSRDPSTLEGHSHDDNDNRPSDLSEPHNGTPAKSLGGDNSGCGEPSGLPNEDNPISKNDDDGVEDDDEVHDDVEEEEEDDVYGPVFEAFTDGFNFDAIGELHTSTELQEEEEEDNEFYDDVEEEEEEDEVYDDEEEDDVYDPPFQAFYDSFNFDGAGASQTPTEVQEEEPNNAATQEHGGGSNFSFTTGDNKTFSFDGFGNVDMQEQGGSSTRLNLSGPNALYNRMFFSGSGNTVFQESNHGIIGETNEEVGGKKLTFRGAKLLIDDVEVIGIDASVRPIKIKWENNELEVRGQNIPQFRGITGKGYWYK